MTIKQTALAVAIGGMLATPGHAGLVISEYVEGSSNNKAVELRNTGSAPVDLTAWELQVYFNGSSTPGLTIDLAGEVAAGGHFVFAHSAADPAILAVADQTTGAGLFNGDDAITLLEGGVVADSLGQVGVDPGSAWGSGETRTQNATLRRLDGSAADTDPFDAYDPAATFAGFPQDSFDDLGVGDGDGDDGGDDGSDPDQPNLSCGADATPISAIQGTTTDSPLAGDSLVIEAVVTGVFNGDGGLGGFFVEEEASDRDDNPLSSEGLFVYAPDAAVSVGQRVRVAGSITEYGGLTELTDLSGLADCGNTTLPAAATLALPWDTLDAPEAYESMRVSFSRPLTVNDTYDLARYGSLTLGSDRHFIPTNIVAPGDDAAVVAELNARDRLILDDGSNQQNPALVPYPTPQLSAAQTVRAGDQVTDLTGILDYRYDEWRLHPSSAPGFISANNRPAGPELTDRGDLVVAAFNVLNFFNGDGFGGGFPTARGADTAEELQRQTAKLVSAISALDADIIGLMEIENDGYGDTSAIAELAAALGGSWAYIDPGLEQLGNDDIAVGLLYRSDRVTPQGAAATLSEGAFAELNRRPLAQTFVPVAGDDGVTVVVNHFKSKGCRGADGANADQGDGQGCWNPMRTQAAEALAGWLANDATGTGEADVLVIGDLNSYAKEDPIQSLVGDGYQDLVARFAGEQAYSYVFYGQAGYLDHALANSPLQAKIADATVWHINADEPRALDYNTEFQTPQQQASYYAPDAYRASDHDPVLVSLTLAADEPADRADLNGDGRVNGRDVARFILAYLFGRADVEHYDVNADGRVDRHDLRAILQVIRER